jgi:hypothetical protein
MDTSVNIPFLKKIKIGENKFKVKIDKKFLKKPYREFSFSSLSLFPDYYKQKAIVEHNFSFNIKYSTQLYKTFEGNSDLKPIVTFIKEINQFFEDNKPSTWILSALAFDWVYVKARKKGTNVWQHYIDNAKLLYGQDYDEKLHTGWLPQSYRELKLKSEYRLVQDLNDFQFPTNPEVFKDIRFRVVVAPNVKVTFKDINHMFLDAIGIPTEVGQDKTRLNVHVMYSTFASDVHSHTGRVAPNLNEQRFGTIITCLPLKTTVKSKSNSLQTTRENESNPQLLAGDYNKAIANLAERFNIKISLEYDKTLNKFLLNFPPKDSGVTIEMVVDSYVAKQLGYGNVKKITINSSSSEYQSPNFEHLANVLALDTGMVLVCLNDLGSRQTHQFTKFVMGILEPTPMGILTNRVNCTPSKIFVSPLNSTLEFSIYKFNENNQPIPLQWNIACYVTGVLIGINS